MQENGNSFEAGRLWGLLQGHMQSHGEAMERHDQKLDRLAEIMLDTKDAIHALPSRMPMMTAIPPASANPSRILPEVSDLIRALYPILILLIAGFGKATWPTALPLIRDVLDLALKASGS